MGMVVHDLRGPLGNLRMCSELLQNPMTTAQEANMFFDFIDEMSGKMLNLVNDLLDINAIESGQLVLEPIETDIQTFFASQIK